MTNVAGHFCSHIRKVSQAVSAAMSQVHWWHMRTRLYIDKNDGRIFCGLKLTNSLHYFQTFSVIFQNRVQQKVMLNRQCYFCPS